MRRGLGVPARCRSRFRVFAWGGGLLAALAWVSWTRGAVWDLVVAGGFVVVLAHLWALTLFGWRTAAPRPESPRPAPTPGSARSRADAAVGLLWGTALGDALGLAAEGMGADAIRRRFGRLVQPRLLCGLGFVSDDTEQAALLAQSLMASSDLEGCVRRFRRALLGWFLRAPFGIGLGTLRACVRIALGFGTSGVRSAGNGAAMRAGVLGVAFVSDPEARARYGRALARVTHTDERAVAGALFVAELAALCTTAEADADRRRLVREAASRVAEPALAEAVIRAVGLVDSGATVDEAARGLGSSGFVLHSVPFAAFCFARGAGSPPLDPIVDAASAGGDTDTTAAIVGAWVGALLGPDVFPESLLGALHDGPFGPTHLRRLGEAVARARPGVPPGYSAVHALVRNLALYPVILGHGLRRLWPR